MGLADASMWRVILRFMRSRLAVACAVITLSVGLILFSVVSIASHRAHSVRSVRASTAAAQLHVRTRGEPLINIHVESSLAAFPTPLPSVPFPSIPSASHHSLHLHIYPSLPAFLPLPTPNQGG